MTPHIIREDSEVKYLSSPDYHYMFNKENGMFARWGKTVEDNPLYSPFGPEIMDIEIVKGGYCSGQCSFCYKCNNLGTEFHYMTLEEMRIILSKLPKTITQIAYGITDIVSNRDFWNILRVTKEAGIIPNYTTNGNGVTEHIAALTKQYCGAVAVSLINKETSYSAIKMFTDVGMKQVNIHYMLSDETLEEAFNVVDDMQNRFELKEMNAIVFLSYKHKNQDSPFHAVKNIADYKRLIKYCLERKIKFGFDSCSAGMAMKALEDEPNFKEIAESIDPCESGLFSLYMDTYGKIYPCSFVEDTNHFICAILDEEVKDFEKDVWYHPKMVEWRDKLIKSSSSCINCKLSSMCRSCPEYETLHVCKE
jgi:radical SAM protein with 4Fe4S-binding SPASM domain